MSIFQIFGNVSFEMEVFLQTETICKMGFYETLGN